MNSELVLLRAHLVVLAVVILLVSVSERCKERGLAVSPSQAEAPTINTTEQLSSDEENVRMHRMSLAWY